MMTRQTRHQAARTPSKQLDAGLPEPGQALVGLPQPQRSLFGVPQPAAWETPRPRPPRPRASQDDDPGSLVRPRPRARRRAAQRSRRSWLQLLGLPLAILTLGAALGVITVVMLIAAGVPAP